MSACGEAMEQLGYWVVVAALLGLLAVCMHALMWQLSLLRVVAEHENAMYVSDSSV
jgi:hypothetical protein